MSRQLYLSGVATQTKEARANRVRVARVTSGLTQAELAAATGVSRQTVNALEAGNYAPSVYLALRVARALRTTVEALFDEEEPS
jgi:putative transcriptional regulator